ncbi:MAG: response regulator [Lysobacterales bacterium]
MIQSSILIAEDEPKIARLLADYLADAGHRVDMCHDGSEVVTRFTQMQPCLVLLDIMMPNRDGIEVCREIRTMSNVPIIMVTARVDEIDRLLGLGVGADDYICKPFSPREVVARVAASLRRQQWLQNPEENSDSDLAIDSNAMLAEFNQQKLDLTPVEFRLLETFVQNPAQVFSRAQLMDRAYTDHRVVSDRTIDSHVKNLRQKLTAACPESQRIHSVYGTGYRYDPSG